MKLFLKKYCLSMILILISLSKINAQNKILNEQYGYAKKLYSQEKYFDAITEFKRLIFFDKSGSFKYSANEMIGNCYKMGAKFSDAILYYNYAEINAKNSNQIYNSQIEIIRANILRRTTERALQLLDSLQSKPKFAAKVKELNYWRGWAYIFADNWQNAFLSFSKVDSAKELSLICKKVESEKYSVSFAKIISHFIPGAGQIYTGHYISGILSLGWNILWGYTSINALAQNRIFDGIMVANFLWLRFYTGNLQNSEKFAVEENLKITNKALNYLQYDYKGTKP